MTWARFDLYEAASLGRGISSTIIKAKIPILTMTHVTPRSLTVSRIVKKSRLIPPEAHASSSRLRCLASMNLKWHFFCRDDEDNIACARSACNSVGTIMSVSTEKTKNLTIHEGKKRDEWLTRFVRGRRQIYLVARFLFRSFGRRQSASVPRNLPRRLSTPERIAWNFFFQL